MHIIPIEEVPKYMSRTTSIVEQYSSIRPCNFYINEYNSMVGNNEIMSQINEFKLRRAHWEGKGGIACCVNIPKQFAERMGLDKQSFLKVMYMNEDNKLVVEKLVFGGQIDNK